MRIMLRYRKTVTAVLVAAVLFIGFQVLYVDYAKKRKTEPYQLAMNALHENAAARERWVSRSRRAGSPTAR
jgi:hypothetical protein